MMAYPPDPHPDRDCVSGRDQADLICSPLSTTPSRSSAAFFADSASAYARAALAGVPEETKGK